MYIIFKRKIMKSSNYMDFLDTLYENTFVVYAFKTMSSFQK